MLSVFICEDDLDYKEKITKCISNYIMMENLDMEIALSTANPDDILLYIQNKRVCGLYILDIELNEQNGVEIARKIRLFDPRGFIVFVTAHTQYLELTFKYSVEALAYIKKTDTDYVFTQICKSIENAYQKHTSRLNTGCFTFKTPDNRYVSLDYDDIYFFKSDHKDSRRVIVYSNIRPYTFYETLNKLQNLLNDDFFRCHKSYIVNLKNIQELSGNNDTILMKNGVTCLVSARKKSALHKKIRGGK